MRGVVLVLGLMAAAALPASAQRAAAEIALVESVAPAGAVVLGEVRAEIHQTSLFAKTPARDLADKELRAQAAKLGADAVVDVRYENSSPLFSKQGFRAAGKAVKLSQAPVQVASPPVSDREVGRTATFALAEPVVAPTAVTPQTPPVAASMTSEAPTTPPAPQVPPITPTSQPPAQPELINVPVIATSHQDPTEPFPADAAPPVPNAAPAAQTLPEFVATVPTAPTGSAAPQVVQPLPVAAAANPAAPRGPTPEALIVLTEEDLVGRAYDRLGEVQAEARQTSLFPKNSARAMLDSQLRAKAAALGADAVILIGYENYSPLFSKRGATAIGVAVKYR